MSLGNDFNMYKEEIELVRAQNRAECDLYSIIASIMRERKQANEISLRDVSARQATVFSKKFKGDSGFPDFVIRTRDRNNDEENLLGAVEVKYVGVDLDLEKHLEQLGNHLKRYRRVVYTDGLKWRYYVIDELRENYDNLWEWEIDLGIVVGDIYEGEVSWCKNVDEKWTELLGKLDKINWNDKK